MRRLPKHRRGLAILDNTAEVHDSDFVGQILHHTQIVRDEQIGEPMAGLEIA